MQIAYPYTQCNASGRLLLLRPSLWLLAGPRFRVPLSASADTAFSIHGAPPIRPVPSASARAVMMAFGIHWEWRGFGELTDDFRARFESLEALFPKQSLTDEYLWFPGLQINLKFRKGTSEQDGLKFKRLRERRGELEQWYESPDEIFDFPLDQVAWGKLRDEFAATGMRLPVTVKATLTRDVTVRILEEADSRVRVVKLDKERVSNVWSGEEGDVKVEIAEISVDIPRRKGTLVTTSVGLENHEKEPHDTARVGPAIAPILAAKRALAVQTESLKVMNYLQAVGEWAGE